MLDLFCREHVFFFLRIVDEQCRIQVESRVHTDFFHKDGRVQTDFLTMMVWYAQIFGVHTDFLHKDGVVHTDFLAMMVWCTQIALRKMVWCTQIFLAKMVGCTQIFL